MIQILTGIQNTSAALDAEQTRLEVISQNIANAHTAHDVDGKPYQRRVVVFDTVLQNAMGGDVAGGNLPAVQVAKIERDTRPPLQIYDPGNPDADGRGMVSMPNVNIHEEMADLISASRSYDANLAVVKNARSMALQTLSIGKH
jgi:flagellar basal-body rod protein FlgC